LIVVNIDGLCEPVNPGGIATYGYVVRDESGSLIAKKSGVVGKGAEMSNNVAEYAALCECLGLFLDRGMADSPIEVRSDSTLVVNQMAGNWKFREGLYKEKYVEAKRLTAKFTRLKFQWVPREQNEEADLLSREAYAAATKR
jgi:ribonuclease HI